MVCRRAGAGRGAAAAWGFGELRGVSLCVRRWADGMRGLAGLDGVRGASPDCPGVRRAGACGVDGEGIRHWILLPVAVAYRILLYIL